MLDFWSIHCKPCEDDLPELKSLNLKYSRTSFEIIGINQDFQRDQVKAYITEKQIDWIQILDYLDNDKTLEKLYGIDAMPTYVLINR